MIAFRLEAGEKDGYDGSMRSTEYYIVYPEGEAQEIDGRLGIGAFVDLNGAPLALPLPTRRMIVYRVGRISTREGRNAVEILHYLELVPAAELPVRGGY